MSDLCGTIGQNRWLNNSLVEQEVRKVITILMAMLMLSVGVNVGLISAIAVRPVSTHKVVFDGLNALGGLIRRLWNRNLCLGMVACALLVNTGCDQVHEVRALPAPAAESPPMNPPIELRKTNWVGSKGEGSCVHASLVTVLRWMNQFELGERWRATYENGEWDSQLRDRLDAAQVDYVYTVKADPRFLDAVSLTRRGCILWWKTSHCCTFAGWVTDADGRQYAAIIDNNHPQKFEFTPREQFIRLWSGYGGFALTPLYPPATSIPYRSYEVR